MSLLWTDLETTGLSADKCQVLEVAAIATDDALQEIGRFQSVVWFEPTCTILELFERGLTTAQIAAALGHEVSEYVIGMHWKNQLWVDCVAYGQPLADVDRRFAEFIQAHAVKSIAAIQPGGELKYSLDKPQLAGSTISFDRKFIRKFIEKQLPLADAQLHYRNLDISSYETGRRFWPETYKSRPAKPEADRAHRGMADIEESIAVFKHYLKCLTQNFPEA